MNILKLSNAFMSTYVVDMFVDFIGDDYNIGVFGQYVSQSFEFFFTVYATGWI